MKILVLCEDYPNLNRGRSMAFVHTRNVNYQKLGIKTEVLSFSAKKNYVIDSIQVYSKASFGVTNIENYDLIISHAPNLKHHYTFLKENINHIRHLVFFFHGHEVLKINKVYSEPYYFAKKNYFRRLFQDIYDEVKFCVWRNFFKCYGEKIHLVFVSLWMKQQFERWVNPKDMFLIDNSTITYNSVNEVFEKEAYDTKCPKEYDFITIRGNLDGSKYAIDIVNRLAKENKSYNFLIIGRGDFFNHYQKADNITWLDCTMKQSEMIEWMNKSYCAMMPTRTDAQGVMMCEMEAFGMPVITSDIPVCHEVFDGFENVAFIDNDSLDNDLQPIYERIKSHYGKHDRYFLKNTIKEEINLFKNLVGGGQI